MSRRLLARSPVLRFEAQAVPHRYCTPLRGILIGSTKPAQTLVPLEPVWILELPGEHLRLTGWAPGQGVPGR